MIYALEGLRGIAAVIVAMLHGWSSNLTDFTLFRQGWLFVDLFFVISGYVMSHVYREKIGSLREAGAFVIRRLGRLYPMHIATLIAFIFFELSLQVVKLASSIGHTPPTFDLLRPWSLLSNIALLHGLGFAGERQYNAPSWSISSEMWAYALFALTVLALYGAARVRTWAVLSLAGLVLWIITPDADPSSFFFRCLYGFYLGSMLPLIRAKFSPSCRAAGVLQGVTGGFAFAVLWVVDGFKPAQFVAPCVFAAFVLAVSFDHGAVASLLRTKPFQTLGRLSYSVYMTHWVLLVFFNPIGTALSEPYRSLLRVAYVCVVLTISELTYRWIEAPCRKRIYQFAERLSAPKGGVPA